MSAQGTSATVTDDADERVRCRRLPPRVRWYADDVRCDWRRSSPCLARPWSHAGGSAGTTKSASANQGYLVTDKGTSV